MRITICAALAGAGVLVASGDEVRPRAMEVLPLGAVRAEGWLFRQLEKQRDGLTGHAEELYDDIGQSDWLTGGRKGGQFAWERGPYYAKGLIALAFVLDDAALKAKAKRWVDAFLASQRADGDFGPRNDNYWANMVVLHCVRDWMEATGDTRVEPFLRRYFAWHASRLAAKPLLADSTWAACRVGDEIEVMLWLADRTGDAALADTARLLAKQASDWTDFYHSGGDGAISLGYRTHIVNFMQGLKLPALKWRLGGTERDRLAYRAAFDPQGWAMRMHGRVDRMVNGTEPLSGRAAAQGTELCAIAERILSCREVAAALGDVGPADDLEVVAFNALPATLGDDGRGMRYYLILNQPQCTVDSRHGFECNGGGDSTTPGPDAGFGCCRSNFHFAWPKFVQSLWMRREGGLAAVAYAPSLVTTERATVRGAGAYPFGDEFTLEIVKADGSRWPLFVRVPGWCGAARIAVNGAEVNGAVAGRFCRIDRAWRAGDKVELSFPGEVTLDRGINDSLAVRRGPLVYALGLAAEVSPAKKGKVREGWPAREYRPKEVWNRVLVAKDAQTLALAAFEPATAEPSDPFVHGAAPCAVRVKLAETQYCAWGRLRPQGGCIYTARAEEPPPSPIPESETRNVVEAKLVPLGSTQVRLTLLPWTLP